VELPEGSRERASVVNLVDPDAAAELDDFLAGDTDGLPKSLNLFLSYYIEQYDFVFVVTDHEVTATTTCARYAPVTRLANPGVGLLDDIQEPGYLTSGRTRAVVGVSFTESGPWPLAHELLHHWASYLATGATASVPSDIAHGWGYLGVHGVLGGFDPATLECVLPPGESPPNCLPDDESGGLYSYRVAPFGPTSNSVPVYAPLELYLMGLVPIEEVPAPVFLLHYPWISDGVPDPETGTIEVTTTPIEPFDRSQLLEGTRNTPPDSEHAFTAAFVVISDVPATDAVLDAVGAHAASFGDRGENPAEAFATFTGGRATLDTRLGSRRPEGSPPPTRTDISCDVLAQDCPSSRACHLTGRGRFCGVIGSHAEAGPCGDDNDCARGLTCVRPILHNYLSGCQRFCSTDADSPQSCSTCPHGATTLDAGDGTVHACMPPYISAGGTSGVGASTGGGGGVGGS
jgi:hypothetical protein